MITQIEIDGFKTFKDFKVELAPFQVIVGPNGSGKSNLFDALHLLSRLAETDLRSAFQGLRGSADDLFMTLQNGQHVDRIYMAVEVLVDRKVRDGLGQKAELKYTRLRYEIEVVQHTDEHGLDQLHVAYESLKPISQDEDNWCKKYGVALQNYLISETANKWENFIDTKLSRIDTLESATDDPTKVVEQLMIYLYPDGNNNESIRRFYVHDVQQTILSRTGNADYPHVFAMREEMRSLKFLHLKPEVMRQPSSVKASPFLAVDGSNLPTVIAHMRAQDRFLLNDISRDLANLVPDVVGIELKKHPTLNEYTIWVKYEDGRSFPAQVLSDGTLRLLALATLKNDPQFHGVLCFEEPENGVHPSHLKEIVRLLKGLVTDFNDSQQIAEPLRQVLVTTHSPVLISQPDVIDVLLFAYTTTHIEPGKYALQITQMVPVITSEAQNNSGSDIDKGEERYSIHQIERYLDTGNFDEARTHLGRR